MILTCRYITDQPRDYRIGVFTSLRIDYALRALGHPAETSPVVEFVNEDVVSRTLRDQLITAALKFHFGITNIQHLTE